MQASLSFGKNLQNNIEKYGNLCIGLDPSVKTLKELGFSQDHKGCLDFGLKVLEKCQEARERFSTSNLGENKKSIVAIKPQSAFFEVFGSKGIYALETITQKAKELGIICILDVKRGDIGSTMQGYANAYLGANSPVYCNAITLSPYLGFGSLMPAIQTALENSKGIFVLALTSNPEGVEVQHAICQDLLQQNVSVAKNIIMQAKKANSENLLNNELLGNIGLVIGATIKDTIKKLNIDISEFNGPILAPGVGAQGGNIKEVFGSGNILKNLLIPVSRGFYSNGIDGILEQISVYNKTL